MSEKLPRGYRRKRHPDPLPIRSEPALTNSIIGADQLARIEREASLLAPAPEPEDLLAAWARAFYRSQDVWWLYRIGLYVAEDLKLMGKVE